MMPDNEQDLAAVIRDADTPLAIEGGGTRGMPAEGTKLSTAGLRGITLYEPGALTLVAKAGTPVAEIEAALAEENQRLAFEPVDTRAVLGREGVPTIGGVVATNASGPRRIQVGACRDHLLGVRFVDGAGHIVKNGGRVMKNVTGYDLVKLMAGSFGTLGVLSEVSLKVLPLPEAETTLTLDGLSPAQAALAMSAALGSPFDVTGAAYVGGAVLIRLEGFAGSVDYRAAQLSVLLQRFGTVVAGDADWSAVRDVTSFAGQAGDVWRVSVRPSDMPDTVARIEQGGAATFVCDWGGGLIWVLCNAGRDIRPDVVRGHATRVRGTSTDIPRFHPEAAPVAALSRGLRQRFDPRGILNAGVMG